MNNIGLYIHIPFCLGKCGYCDFYSTGGSAAQYDEYTNALLKRISFSGERFSRCADTVYIGGGTPTLLGGKRLSDILHCAKRSFFVPSDAEITVEANPADDLYDTLASVAAAGVNRLSVGVQSSNEVELGLLGRRHRNGDVLRTVREAREVGIGNISLDLMLGIPSQTTKSLGESIDFLLSLSPEHISAYMLKIEPGTPFFDRRDSLDIPDPDRVADMYLYAADRLECAGYRQYEISNFSKPGYESRHNLKYWRGDEYLGIGPAAHSFVDGKRFFYPRSTQDFIDGKDPVPDGAGGSAEEYIMLSLRLSEGINLSELKKKYGVLPTERYIELVKRLIGCRYAKETADGFSLTPRGMLLQSEIVIEILEALSL